MMALTPKRLFLYLCISISLLRPYTLFSRSPLVNKTLFENACELKWVVLYFKDLVAPLTFLWDALSSVFFLEAVLTSAEVLVEYVSDMCHITTPSFCVIFLSDIWHESTSFASWITTATSLAFDHVESQLWEVFWRMKLRHWFTSQLVFTLTASLLIPFCFLK